MPAVKEIIQQYVYHLSPLTFFFKTLCWNDSNNAQQSGCDIPWMELFDATMPRDIVDAIHFYRARFILLPIDSGV